MLFGFEVFPLCLYLTVQFQFRIAFRKHEAQFLIDRD